jgi:SAM-dependent methyltransferase
VTTDVEIVTVEGVSPALEWEIYSASGLPQYIGHFHLCLVLNALHRSGLAARLVAAESLSEREFSACITSGLGSKLLRYLKVRGLVREEVADHFRLTDRGSRLLCDVGRAQLQFYVDAYSPVTTRLDALLTGTAHYPEDIQRNGAALGAACDELFTVFHTPIIHEILAALRPRRIVDLGCGGGRMLSDACRHFPELEGLGLDISPGAVALARERSEALGLRGRLQFRVADAFDLSTWPEAARSADVFAAVGAVHEHFRDGEQAVLDILDTYAGLMRENNAKAFILGEPELHYDDAENDADLHLVHIFTAQGFPRPRREWLDLIARSGLNCRQVFTRDRVGPRFCFYVLTV